MTEIKHKSDDIWITPNAMIEMRQGREQDKALLMACMMRGAIEETTEEVTKSFKATIKEESRKLKIDKKITQMLA